MMRLHGMKLIRRVVISCTFACSLLSPNLASSERPEEVSISAPVVDQVGLLNSRDFQQLETILKKINSDTSNEIAIAIIDNLGGLSLEDFSLRVANQNRIGKRIKNNGILILLAITDRQVRIEVGYGLENVITDDIAGSILRNNMIPHFKQKDFSTGLREGINALRKRMYEEDVKHYFSMKWDIGHFEDFIAKYPQSSLRCDALMFLGRFYEDLWSEKFFKFLGENHRKKSIEGYMKYLDECPDGIWRTTVEHELSLVNSKKPDSRRYLIHNH